MRKGFVVAAVAVLVGAASLVSCTGNSSKPLSRAGQRGPGADAKKGRPVVYASAYPLRYFAERIAGDAADVRLLAPVDEDAEYYTPDAESIRALQKADLILINGALLEKWLRKVMLPESRVVDTSKPLRGAYIILEEAVTHSHGPQGAHAHEGVVAQTWLDPKQAAVQAGEIAKALSRLVPERAARFEKNVEALHADLEEIDRSFAEAFKEYDNRHFYFSHPVYHYFVRRYELNAGYLHLRPEEMPDDATFESIKRRLQTKPAEYVVWEFDPAEEIARRLRDELGLRSVRFETCSTYSKEQAEAGMDYLAIMRRNLAQIRPCFAARSGPRLCPPTRRTRRVGSGG